MMKQKDGPSITIWFDQKIQVRIYLGGCGVAALYALEYNGLVWVP